MGSNFDFINQLKEDNVFDQLIKRGLISVSYENYHYIYSYYLSCLKKSKTKLQAINETSEKFNISERGVYVIINKMK
jgi:hypothetical protein